MADQNTPNRASNMEKAEGDRETIRDRGTDDRSDDGANHPGITNRDDAEESENQQRVPRRGEAKNGAHA